MVNQISYTASVLYLCLFFVQCLVVAIFFALSIKKIAQRFKVQYEVSPPIYKAQSLALILGVLVVVVQFPLFTMKDPQLRVTGYMVSARSGVFLYGIWRMSLYWFFFSKAEVICQSSLEDHMVTKLLKFLKPCLFLAIPVSLMAAFGFEVMFLESDSETFVGFFVFHHWVLFIAALYDVLVNVLLLLMFVLPLKHASRIHQDLVKSNRNADPRRFEKIIWRNLVVFAIALLVFLGTMLNTLLTKKANESIFANMAFLYNILVDSFAIIYATSSGWKKENSNHAASRRASGGSDKNLVAPSDPKQSRPSPTSMDARIGSNAFAQTQEAMQSQNV